MIKRFKQIEGRYIEKIIGQDRLAYAMSDSEDFYDLIEWSKRGGYQGSVIMFYDFENGNVYKPFAKKRDTIYGKPIYMKGFYYFLQGDYKEKKIKLYKYLPEQILELVTEMSTDEVNLYNLRIIGNEVHIISQENDFCCYYPEKVTFSLQQNETVAFMDEGKVYIEAWVEEGWDDEKDCATDDYRYYEKILVRDEKGNLLSEEIGSLYQAQDGTWWIA